MIVVDIDLNQSFLLFSLVVPLNKLSVLIADDLFHTLIVPIVKNWSLLFIQKRYFLHSFANYLHQIFLSLSVT